MARPHYRVATTAVPRQRRLVRKILVGVAWHVMVAAAFVGIAIALRAGYIGSTKVINPDEAELMAQARAAMRSPVPFTTWATSTTGPIWVLFLAALGAIGFPLTIPFAHLLSAVLIGLLGYLGLVLARRVLGAAVGVAVTAFWWLPIVLILTGSAVDFAALNTELLPSVLVGAAAVIPTAVLVRFPALYLAVGLICGLAVGAKYQVMPVAMAVLLVHLVLIGDFRWQTIVRGVSLWSAGVLLPLAVVGIAMLTAPDVSADVVKMNFQFLESYSGQVSIADRLSHWRLVVTRMHVVLLVLVVVWLGVRSVSRVQVCRGLVVLAGLVAVFAGGMLAPHYLYFLYITIALAIGLPLYPGARLVPVARRPAPTAGVVALVAVFGWTLSFGPTLGVVGRPTRASLATALSSNGVQRDPRLAAVCPVGSSVVVWGWAPELYVNYSWTNAIPFVNVAQLTITPKNRSLGHQLIQRSIANRSTQCVVDAVGAPFFPGVSARASLTKFYPDIRTLLAERYRRAEKVLDCKVCAVYIRR